MKEARELIGRGVSKFREFQSRRREAALERRSIPTKENWFWLMDQIEPAEEDKPVDYIIQNPNYFVKVGSISGYTDSGNFVEKKYLRVTQPLGIKNHEVFTIFSSASLDGQDPKCIGFLVRIFDTSTHPPKIITDKDSGGVVFGREGHIVNVNFPHELADGESCMFAPEEGNPPNKDDCYLTHKEVSEVIHNAYKVAFTALTREIVPEGVQPASPTLLQRPFKLQLI